MAEADGAAAGRSLLTTGSPPPTRTRGSCRETVALWVAKRRRETRGAVLIRAMSPAPANIEGVLLPCHRLSLSTTGFVRRLRMASQAETERVRRKKKSEGIGTEVKVDNFDAIALSFARRSTCCLVCHVRLATSVEEPVSADCLASPSSTWQAPPPTTHHSGTHQRQRQEGSGRCDRKICCLRAPPPFHSFHAVSPQLRFRFRHSPTTHLASINSPVSHAQQISRLRDETRSICSWTSLNPDGDTLPMLIARYPPQAPQAPAPAPIRSLSISHIASRPVARQERTLLFPRRPDCQTTTHWPAAAGRRTLAPCLHGGAPAPAWPDLTTPGSIVRDSLTPTHQVLERAGLRGTRR